MNDFSPLELLDKWIKQWWLLVILTVFGGLVGGAIHFYQPALYTAEASLSTSLDTTQTGPLDEINIDYALEMVSTLIKSTQVRENFLAAAQAQNIPVDVSKMYQSSERRNELWILKIRYPNAEVASQLANLWLEEAYKELTEATLHSQQARYLENHLTSLENCLKGVTITLENEVPCTIPSFTDLQAEIQSTSSSWVVETQGSRGISSALSFDITERAVPPSQPSANGRNTLVFSGGIIGFLIGVLSISIDLPYRLAKVLHRV